MSSFIERLLEERDAAIDEFHDFLKGESERRSSRLAAKSEHELTNKQKIALRLEKMRRERNERERFESKVEARKTLYGVK